MRISVGRLKIVNDLALVPDVIAGGKDLDTHLEEFFRKGGRYAEAGGSILAVCDDQVDAVLLDKSRQPVLDDSSSRPPKDVTDKKNAHGFDGNTQ